MQDIRRKVYVSVLAEMTPTGYAQPKVITWEDGTKRAERESDTVSGLAGRKPISI